MQADPLQQLRDIHVPAEPSWWPPAPGWWLLAGLCLGLIFWLYRQWQRRQQQQAPLRQAASLYRALHTSYVDGELNATGYIHGTNELLKRLLIHTQTLPDAGSANDEQWLELLDNIAGTTEFTEGPGQVLGNVRFAPQVAIDEAAFDPLIRRFIGGLTP